MPISIPTSPNSRSWQQFDAELEEATAPHSETARLPTPTETVLKSQGGRCICQRSWAVVVAGLSLVIGALVVGAVVLRLVYASSASGADDSAPERVYFHLRVEFATLSLAGYRVALMTYNGSIPGPTLTVTPGAIVDLFLENALPPNRAHSGTANLSCWHPPPNWKPPSYHGSNDARGDPTPHLPSEAASSPLDYVNTPRDFRTTNFHMHGLQVGPEAPRAAVAQGRLGEGLACLDERIQKSVRCDGVGRRARPSRRPLCRCTLTRTTLSPQSCRGVLAGWTCTSRLLTQLARSGTTRIHTALRRFR
jgi:hypothetical protein